MAVETNRLSSSSSYNYEVFLSFRGEDTRTNFTDHLYHALYRAGIRTFRDNEELKQGEEIGPELLKAIKESKISILVFSKNYASSKWCLKELVQIIESKETDGQVVWPIFYKVDPSDVRKQSGNFAHAFLEHEETQSKETLDKWREALSKAGTLSGWDSEDPKNRWKFYESPGPFNFQGYMGENVVTDTIFDGIVFVPFAHQKGRIFGDLF